MKLARCRSFNSCLRKKKKGEREVFYGLKMCRVKVFKTAKSFYSLSNIQISWYKENSTISFKGSYMHKTLTYLSLNCIPI